MVLFEILGFGTVIYGIYTAGDSYKHTVDATERTVKFAIFIGSLLVASVSYFFKDDIVTIITYSIDSGSRITFYVVDALENVTNAYFKWVILLIAALVISLSVSKCIFSAKPRQEKSFLSLIY
eukprot:33522_1